MVDSKVLESSNLRKIYINKSNVDSQIQTILDTHPITTPDVLNAWLLKAVTVIDLTTLSGDDARSNVFRLCTKAANPLPSDLLKKLDLKEPIRTAAVCVYSTKVKDAYEAIKLMNLTSEINIAAVATGFPSGLYPLETRLQEIKYAVSSGATEIDVVLDRSLALTGQWDALYDEVKQMKKACGPAHLKVILGVGELGSYENVYRASMISMMAGADFIKTSTGKEAVNATLPIGLVMCRAIRRHYQNTGIRVGLKPAGGIKTARDAVNWLVLVYTELGPEWLTPKLFRIGASSLLAELVNNIVVEKKNSE